jgi:sialate O-acetylesterase
MEKSLLMLTLCFSLLNTKAASALQLAKVFSDNMVLQQQQVVPIWGKAKARSKVLVRFLAQAVSTKADESGDWYIELSPLSANHTPAQLIIEAEKTIIINNILVGEVWLSSGQSNMRFSLAKSLNGDKTIEKEENNSLRLLDFSNKKFYPEKTIFNVEDLEELTPDNYFQSQGWQISNEKNRKQFSAVAYHFAQKLQEQLGVPVGIINVSIGGSLMENYISKEKLASIKPLAKLNGYWLDNIPKWCADRARYNLSAWLEQYPNTLPNHPFKPSFLFEAGIKPLVPFAIKGVIWYQGESNAPIQHSTVNNTISAYQGEVSLKLSKIKFEALISEWRMQWKNNKLPFNFVQLPGLNRPWAPFREMQSEIANELTNVGMVTTYDLGHATDVHPKNKQPVGLRLANLALNKDYQKELVANGPIFISAVQVNSTIRVNFKVIENNNSALAIIGPAMQLNGFEISGEDGVFKLAQAVIKNKHIIVSHPNISIPKMVRYAWFDDPKEKANLGNRVGLPATPFNTHLNTY